MRPLPHQLAGFALAFQPQQLLTIAGESAEKATVSLGLTDEDYFSQSSARLAGSSTLAASTADRARSWLHGNCAHRHRQNGGGSVAVVLNIELTDDQTATVGEKLLRGDFGLTDAQIIHAGAPWESALYSRIARIGSGHMPLIGAREPDEAALKLVWDWIHQMPHTDSDPKLPDSPDTASNALMLMHAIDSGTLTGDEKQRVIQSALASNDANIHSLFERFQPPSQRAKLSAPASIKPHCSPSKAKQLAARSCSSQPVN